MDLKSYYENALFLEDGFQDMVQSSEDFYNLTLKRDQAFLNNMLEKMDRGSWMVDGGQTIPNPPSTIHHPSSAVLITGGYHTPNLKKLLKERNISYVVLTPTITHETSQKRYENLLIGSKSLSLFPDSTKVHLNPSSAVTMVDILVLNSASQDSFNRRFPVLPRILDGLTEGARLAGENSSVYHTIFSTNQSVQGEERIPKEEPVDPEIDEILKKESAFIKEEFTLLYGMLSLEHPVSRYVQQVFNETLGEEAKDYNIIIFPEWNEMNAAALPDGTILVSIGLLKFLRFKEELQAVLSHEAIHIKRKHAEIRLKIEEENQKNENKRFRDIILGEIGMSRLNEYDADLRWVVEEFNKRKINPLGEVVFLERLDSYEKSKMGYHAKSLSHGSLQDRQLNIDNIFYFLDLTSLSHDLTDIPEDIKAAIKNVRPSKLSVLWNGSDPFLSFDGLKESERKRLETAKEIPLASLGMAFRDLSLFIKKRERSFKDVQDKEHGEKGYSKKESYLDFQKKSSQDILKQWANRIDEELIINDKWPDPQERSLAKALFYELYVGMNYLLIHDAPKKLSQLLLSTSDIGLFQEEQRRARDFVLSNQNVELLPKIVADPSFSMLPATINRVNYLTLTRLTVDTFKLFVQQKGFESKLSEKNSEDFVNFADSWLKAIGKFYDRSVEKVDLSALFSISMAFIYAKMTSFKKSMERIETLAIERRILKVSEKNKLDTRTERVGKNLAQKIIGRLKLFKPYNFQEFEDIYQEIHQEISGKSLEYIFLFLHEAVEEQFEYLMLKKQFHAIKETNYDIQSMYVRFGKYFIFRLFQEIVKRDSLFKKLSPLKKKVLMLTALHNLVYYLKFHTRHDGRLIITPDFFDVYDELESNHHSHFTKHPILAEEYKGAYEGGDYLLSEEDMDYLDQYLFSPEKDWIEPSRSFEDIIELYRYCVKGDFGLESNLNRYTSGSITEKLFVKIFVNYLIQFNNWDSFFRELGKFEEAGLPTNRIIAENAAQFGGVLHSLWQTLPQKPTKRQLDQIDRSVEFLKEPFLRAKLQSYYYVNVWPTLNFNERMELLFSKISKGIIDVERFREFIQKEVLTKEQFDLVLEKIEAKLDVFLSTPSSQAGLAAIISNFAFDHKEAQDFILALLKTSKSDQNLKQILYRTFDPLEITGFSQFEILKILNGVTNDYEIIFILNKFLPLLELAENRLFGMDNLSKSVLLRKLLTGDTGLISNKAYRSEFLSVLINDVIKDRNEAVLLEIINRVILVLGNIRNLGIISSWKLVYFAIQSLLVDKIAIAPERLTNWAEVLKEELQWKDVNLLSSNLAGQGHMTFEELRQKATVLAKTPWKDEALLLQYSEEVLRFELAHRDVELSSSKSKELTALSFVIEFAQNIGALGVRFLQLLPQFTNLSEEYEGEFSKVFDANQGQAKLTAVAVAKREWLDFWNQVERVEEKVGGGSLMTVYKIIKKSLPGDAEAKAQVIKVLNPNLMYHLKNNLAMIKSILEELIRTDRKKYEVADLVMDDVERWIQRDVYFEGFLKHDEKFKAENHGFKPEEFAYEIYVPQSYGPSSRYLIREEFVEGKNLTKWEELKAEGHDLRQVASLIVKNYIGQLQRGLVHSDVHVGNFRVTPDKKVAILDRNFFLELSPQVRDLVETFFNPFKLMFLSKEDFVNKLVLISETSVTEQQKQALINSWETTYNNLVQNQDFKSVSHFLVDLRKNNLKLPLEVTLIFKNINSLQHISKKAGFSNLLEAYLYNPANAKVLEAKESQDVVSATSLVSTVVPQINLPKKLTSEAGPVLRFSDIIDIKQLEVGVTQLRSKKSGDIYKIIKISGGIFLKIQNLKSGKIVDRDFFEIQEKFQIVGARFATGDDVKSKDLTPKSGARMAEKPGNPPQGRRIRPSVERGEVRGEGEDQSRKDELSYVSPEFRGLSGQADFLKRDFSKSASVSKALDGIQNLNAGKLASGVKIGGDAFTQLFGRHLSLLEANVERVDLGVVSDSHSQPLANLVGDVKGNLKVSGARLAKKPGNPPQNWRIRPSAESTEVRGEEGGNAVKKRLDPLAAIDKDFIDSFLAPNLTASKKYQSKSEQVIVKIIDLESGIDHDRGRHFFRVLYLIHHWVSYAGYDIEFQKEAILGFSEKFLEELKDQHGSSAAIKKFESLYNRGLEYFNNEVNRRKLEADWRSSGGIDHKHAFIAKILGEFIQQKNQAQRNLGGARLTEDDLLVF
jgi:predicted unusual protein kinase regulating ubiquinone biosynthesis (AarF/ABC1/UbiB family)